MTHDHVAATSSHRRERPESSAEPGAPNERRPSALELFKDPLLSARAAKLRHVDDHSPGLRRRGAHPRFRYVDEAGCAVREPETLRRIRALVIPPAWTDVWICPSPDGHLQATGRDARGRKQYRYHARFRDIREETKYERILAFASAVPKIRAAVDAELQRPGLRREKVLATIVRLLEITLIRVGNEEYARENGSFGLTTLRARHVDVHGSTIAFHFRGKSGKTHAVGVHDRRLAKIVARCNELPGEVLFQYVDDEGHARTVESSDVNAFLRELAGEDFTAKDFRTWAGTVLAAHALSETATFASPTAAKKHLAVAIKGVAARLGNTPAVCRKCYVHPAVFEAYLEGDLPKALSRSAQPAEESSVSLSSIEKAVLAMLRARVARGGDVRDIDRLLRASLAAARKATPPRGLRATRVAAGRSEATLTARERGRPAGTARSGRSPSLRPR